jgi:YVTN family beta-propeller protein
MRRVRQSGSECLGVTGVAAAKPSSARVRSKSATLFSALQKRASKPHIAPTMRRVFAGVLLVTLAATSSLDIAHAEGTAAAATVPLKKVADVPLDGRTTRLDYASLDLNRHMLFIAHLGDSEVIAFDVQTSRVIGRVPDVSSVHGVLAIPELNRVYATATGTSEVVAIDPSTLTVTARVSTGGYPDGLAYAPDVHKLYISDERGGNEAVIDVRSNTRIATIALGGEAGNTQYDTATKHIFVNVQTRNQLVEIDPTTDKVLARHDVAGAKRNHGLLIDPEHRLAFIACEGNDTLIVLDMRTMLPVSSFHVGSDPDVLGYDAGLHLLYVASESGPASVFRVGTGRVTKLGDQVIGPNAHVVAIDPSTHRSYFPLKNLDGHMALRVLEPIEQ